MTEAEGTGFCPECKGMRSFLLSGSATKGFCYTCKKSFSDLKDVRVTWTDEYSDYIGGEKYD